MKNNLVPFVINKSICGEFAFANEESNLNLGICFLTSFTNILKVTNIFAEIFAGTWNSLRVRATKNSNKFNFENRRLEPRPFASDLSGITTFASQ